MLPRAKNSCSFAPYISGAGCLTVKNISESVVSSENFLNSIFQSLPYSRMFILGLSSQLFLQQTVLLSVEIANDVRIGNISKITFLLSP